MHADYLHWVEKSNCYGDHIRAGNDRVINIIEEETGLRLNEVCGSIGKGGGSTDGNQSRRFFDIVSLPATLMCVSIKYKHDVSRLHKNLSTILRIISSQDRVHTEMYSKLLTETSFLIARKFMWVQINFTLHGVLHHSCELIIMNEGIGLGALSEEGLEANKDI